MARAAAYGTHALQLAELASSIDGLSPIVELTQWYAEEGAPALHQSQWGSFWNNPAGIKPGNPQADALSNGTTPKGFLSFATPQAGATAYADVMMQSNMRGVRQAASSGQFKAGGHTYVGDAAQLVALGESPWDGGHYVGNTGKVAGTLFSDYPLVSGVALQSTPPSSASIYGPLSGTNLSSMFRAWDTALSPVGQPPNIFGIPGYLVANAGPMMWRLVFLLMAFLLIAFAIFSMLGSKAKSIATIAEGIAPVSGG